MLYVHTGCSIVFATYFFAISLHFQYLGPFVHSVIIVVGILIFKASSLSFPFSIVPLLFCASYAPGLKLPHAGQRNSSTDMDIGARKYPAQYRHTCSEHPLTNIDIRAQNISLYGHVCSEHPLYWRGRSDLEALADIGMECFRNRKKKVTVFLKVRKGS